MAEKKLSATKIERLIKDAKAGRLPKYTKAGKPKTKHEFGDGGGLSLQISNNGAGVSWLLRYINPVTGCPDNMGLGSYDIVNLEKAREYAAEKRLMVFAGKDPKTERDNTRLEQKVARGLVKTVSEVADEYFAKKIARRSKHYRKATTRQLNCYVHKPIGKWPIQKVDRNTILETCGLGELWLQKHQTAKLVQMHFDRIFNLAISRGYYRGQNPAQWKGGLEHVLLASKDASTPKHHASLPYKDAPWFVQELRACQYARFSTRRVPMTVVARRQKARELVQGGMSQIQAAKLLGVVARTVCEDLRRPAKYAPRTSWSELGRPVSTLALDWLILTGVRCGEVVQATWKEINREQLIWTVPKEHTKAKKADRPIPITKSMRAVLDEMHKRHPDHSHDALIFPSEGTRARGGQLSSSTPRNKEHTEAARLVPSQQR
jgi:integrase